MPRQPNPYSKYSQRKARQQARAHYNSLPPGEKANVDAWGCVIFFLFALVIGAIIFLCSGTGGLVSWLSH